MSLREEFENDPIEPEQPRRNRTSHPKGWEPGVKFDVNEVPTEIITAPMEELEAGEWESVLDTLPPAIRARIPAGSELRLAEAKHDPAAWHRDTEFVPDEREEPESGKMTKAPAVTRPVWRYRFVVVHVGAGDRVDPIGVLNTLKRTRKPRAKFDGESTFVTNINDWQLHKDAGGGFLPTVERLDRYFDMALERAKDLGRHKLGELVVLGGGDILEGCAVFPNQSFQISGDRRTQINDAATLVVDFLDRLAPHFGRVRVLAVGGNHGEHRIKGKRVNRHDNDDCLIFETAAREISRDQALQHVTFNVAQSQPALTMDVQGHILALTHGHVYGKARGADPTVKSYEWYKNMAAAHHPVGDATLLVGNHFHHDIVKNWGTLLFVQNPAADGGSPEFADYSGTDCAPGMSTWVMNAESRFRDYEVLR